MRNIRWRELIIIALSVALAWGLRGQHGHERGAAVAGAMTGLAIGAVTGSAPWMGAAVIGSLTFAIGGSLSYGRFVQAAYEGSWEAIGSLALIGFVWGGLGALGLGLGLTLPRYKLWERVVIAGGLFLVWFLVDRLLWGWLAGPDDFWTRELIAIILLSVWALLSSYVGVWRGDSTSLKLAIAGAVGFGIGFPLAAWVQGIGNMTGLRVDWWKLSEHLIGLCGGVSIAAMVLSMKQTWQLPLAVKPWERWAAMVWLLWFLPAWLMANNVDYWVAERAIFPPHTRLMVWVILFLCLFALIVWGWSEMRRGRLFVISWMPRHLRRIFLCFVWITTLLACVKVLFSDEINFATFGFLGMAALITWLIGTYRSGLPPVPDPKR